MSSTAVIGGEFSVVSGASALRVAVLRNNQWEPLGDGFDGPVRCFADIGGTLYAGGDFTHSGSTEMHGIAMWNGSAWQPVGAGLSGGPVRAITSLDGRVIAAGSFDSSGVVPIARVAAWNGTAWDQLGDGLNQHVRGLAVYHGELYACGDFSASLYHLIYRVARFDGVAWQPMGQGADRVVYSMVVWQDRLYFGGAFEHIDGLPYGFLASWNGSAWQGHIPTSSSGLDIRCLAVWNGQLVGAGTAVEYGNVSTGRWTGSGWSRLGPRKPQANYIWSEFNSMASAGSLLLVGATMYCPILGYELRFGVWGWDSARWTMVGTHGGFDRPVTTLATFDNRACVGGRFAYVGSEPLSFVVIKDGESWREVAVDYGGEPLAMVGYSGGLAITGELLNPEGTYFAPVMCTDGFTVTNWCGGYLDGGNRGVAIGIVHGIPLAAGGQYLFLDNRPRTGVFYRGGASAVVEYLGATMLGGNFTVNFTQSGPRILRQDPVLGWVPFPDAEVLFVKAFLAEGASLYAVGAFRFQGSDQGQAVAVWNGSSWRPVGSGLLGSANAIVRYDGDLYVAGSFPGVGGAYGLARFNGNTWVPVPGAPLDIASMTVADDRLAIGGAFVSVDGRPSAYFAQWQRVRVPTVESQPLTSSARRGGVATFETVISGSPPLTFQWLQNGVAIADGPRPGGSVAEGATTPWLTLYGVDDTDVGEYSCRVENSCGEVVSEVAMLTVSDAICAADFNQDGGVDGADVSDFFVAWEVGGALADVNQDGGVDGADVSAFFIAWENGGC
ncbi:MAG: immunoglobulin domain-containing protein [Planctomycetes bacterium]|nr:immunoglobulin domain-containing protein [Planctomycetota bacterium]